MSKITFPVGAIISFFGELAPEGWLACDGSSIPNEEHYKPLRDMIGNNTPNLQNEFLRGWDKSGSRAIGSTQADALRSHQHRLDVWGGANRHPRIGSGGNNGFGAKVFDTAAFGEEETRPRNVAVLFIIFAYDDASLDVPQP